MVIHLGRFEIVSCTTDAILGLQVPTNTTKLWSFVGLYNVFWHFLPKFTRLAATSNKNCWPDQTKRFRTLNKVELDVMKASKDTSCTTTSASLTTLYCTSDTGQGHMLPIGWMLITAESGRKDNTTRQIFGVHNQQCQKTIRRNAKKLPSPSMVCTDTTTLLERNLVCISDWSRLHRIDLEPSRQYRLTGAMARPPKSRHKFPKRWRVFPSTGHPE